MSRLTDIAIKNLKMTGSAYLVADEIVRGMSIRVGSRGEKSFYLFARYPGSPNPRKRLLGDFPGMSLANARATAVRWKGLVKRGVEPDRINTKTPDDRLRDAWSEFAKLGIEPIGFLYRHYAWDGDLLYVGQTAKPAQKRSAEHLKRSDWSTLIAKITIEPFADRGELLAAEAEAIRGEYPRFNKVHNKGRGKIAWGFKEPSAAARNQFSAQP